MRIAQQVNIQKPIRKREYPVHTRLFFGLRDRPPLLVNPKIGTYFTGWSGQKIESSKCAFLFRAR